MGSEDRVLIFTFAAVFSVCAWFTTREIIRPLLDRYRLEHERLDAFTRKFPRASFGYDLVCSSLAIAMSLFVIMFYVGWISNLLHHLSVINCDFDWYGGSTCHNGVLNFFLPIAHLVSVLPVVANAWVFIFGLPPFCFLLALVVIRRQIAWRS